MKKIVDGQVYDTETATKVWEYRFAERCTFFSEEAVLYVIPNSANGFNFFLAGEGGPLSRWDCWVDDRRVDVIVPLDAEMACDWLENVANASNEVMMKYFGDFAVTKA